ncbi:MAG: hypothetical protein P1V20_25320 [Verrucomicrobiales bacterium]|nr:hypothetical protein [Verrucomicrobiales bacterium]
MKTKSSKILLQKCFMIAICSFLLPVLVEGSEPPEKDRKAILAMAGEFQVFFNFEETVPLQKGYELKKPYTEEAHEIVIVIGDTGNQITMQHILTTGNGSRVVKHWKQTWTWEDTRITEFQGNQKWKVRELPAEKVKGTWSQHVTQVDDSPRYESWGRWKHDGGYSRWESKPTNRPLPRREHTKRSDYQILLGVNRHALTPHGWVHGQDNLKKVIREDGGTARYIAREAGLNEYEHIKDHDFSPATDYWTATKDFWSKVSAYWHHLEANQSSFEILKEIDEVSLVKALFEIADEINEKKREVPGEDEIAKIIDPYVVINPST